MNSVHVALSSRGDTFKNLIRANTSSSLFCTGVPVKHSRRSAMRSHEARHATVLSSLMELRGQVKTLDNIRLTRDSLCLIQDYSKPVYTLKRTSGLSPIRRGPLAFPVFCTLRGLSICLVAGIARDIFTVLEATGLL